MTQDTVTFELTTHYLPKIALRLECLCHAIIQACEEQSPIIHHYALKNLIEVLKLIEKPELKSRFLKELMRIEHALNKSQTPISREQGILLHTQIQLLTNMVGRFGEAIHNNLFLQSIRLAQAAHVNEGELYAPQLLFWLESSFTLRQDDFIAWLDNLRLLHSTVTLYLLLLRNTALFSTIETNNGFYQRPLPSNALAYLILLRIDKTFGIVPHVQLGQHGLSLRLCDSSTLRGRTTNAKLELAICQL